MNKIHNKSEMTGVIKLDLIYDYIYKNQITFREFAQKCKISMRALADILDDYSVCDIGDVVKVARAIGIHPADIFK